VIGPGIPMQFRTRHKTMDNSRIIRHPLDRFSFTGNMGNLDAAGRDAAEKLMTMIGDMRFLKDTIWGTCARYFLLIDTSWFPQVCLFAQINSAMLRTYLLRVEKGEEGELENVAMAAQTDFSFPENEGNPAAIINATVETISESPSTDQPQLATQTVRLEQPIQKPPLKRFLALSAAVLSAAQKK
jgi:hypothetical protein